LALETRVNAHFFHKVAHQLVQMTLQPGNCFAGANHVMAGLNLNYKVEVL